MTPLRPTVMTTKETKQVTYLLNSFSTYFQQHSVVLLPNLFLKLFPGKRPRLLLCKILW